MSIGINITILPLSVKEFQDKYGIDEDKLFYKYQEYLKINKDNHHYGEGINRYNWMLIAFYEYRG